MRQVAEIVLVLFDVLDDATRHLRRHCDCSDTSHCIACEVAAEADTALDKVRDWQAHCAALMEPLSHAVLGVEVVASSHAACSTCTAIHRRAADSRNTARVWKEARCGCA